MSDSIHLGVHIDGAGHHPAAWRVAGAQPERLFSADRFVELVGLAEQGLLDFVALDDSFRLDPNANAAVRGQLDALLTMARIAPLTERIGLVPTVTTTHTEPFHVSKNVATLDLVSAGRAGWLVDVSTTEAEAQHFGRRGVAPVDELHAEAGEAIDVVRQLWDSWEDDAVIRDVATGRYIDRGRLHYTNFDGRFFSVRGPSITPRSPQGQSLVMIRGVDDSAIEIGGRHADVVIIDVGSVEQARRVRAQIDAAARDAGRAAGSVSLLSTVVALVGPSAVAAADLRNHLDSMAPSPAAGLDYVGDGTGLADLIETWASSGVVDGFVIRPATLPGTLRHLVDDVVPVLQQRGLFRTAYEGRTLRDHFGLARPDNRYAGARR